MKEELLKIIDYIINTYPDSSPNLKLLDISDDISDIANEIVIFFFDSKLNFCRCGNPEYTMSIVKDYLKIVKTFSDSHKTRADIDIRDNAFANLCGIKIENTKYEGLLNFMTYTLNSADILTHGSSIYGSVLTEEGLMFIQALELSDLLNI